MFCCTRVEFGLIVETYLSRENKLYNFSTVSVFKHIFGVVVRYSSLYCGKHGLAGLTFLFTCNEQALQLHYVTKESDREIVLLECRSLRHCIRLVA